MRLTEEQKKIVSTDLELGQSLIVEAGAGTGKTTCFIEYAKLRPSSKILYLCFNNKAAKEAQEKYKSLGIKNVHTSTIHGLASDIKKKYEKANKFTTKVSIKDVEKNFGYSTKLSWLILETIKNYCYSNDKRIEKSHLPQLIDIKSKASDILIKEAKRVWDKMVSTKEKIPISYDHYLKLYHLSTPKLNYDYILLDEAQDSNPLTLDIIKTNQDHTRTILIGDENQAIYGWRGAKNAMHTWKANQNLKLTESFRFGASIAELSNCILKTYPEGNPRIKGSQNIETALVPPSQNNEYNNLHSISPHMEHTNSTFIARTNSTLFEKAVELQKHGIKCHFVGTEERDNWDPSTAYRLEDLKDIYRLWTGDIKRIKSPLIKIFKDYHELRKIARGGKTEAKVKDNKTLENQKKFGGDKELEFLCRMVEKYQHTLPELVRIVKEQASSPPMSSQDRIITLCTAHRAKGLEWENVEVAKDFIEIIDLTNDPILKDITKDTKSIEYQNYIEEINLLYVACTRAKKSLNINPDLTKLCIKEGIKLNDKGVNISTALGSKLQPPTLCLTI
jgi:superfamily I DNA/RNA helicase